MGVAPLILRRRDLLFTEVEKVILYKSFLEGRKNDDLWVSCRSLQQPVWKKQKLKEWMGMSCKLSVSSKSKVMVRFKFSVVFALVRFKCRLWAVQKDGIASTL